MNIKIGVVNRVATPPSNAVIVCGNSDYTLTFDFDAEWSAENTKIARFVWFSRNKAYSKEITFEGDTVEAPILTNTNAVYVGVYAGNLRTTTPAKIVCEPSILCYGQDANMNPGDLALIKGQIAELVKALKNINADPAAIRNAVIEYLAQNPPKVTETDPTVPAWAKQSQKPKYTAAEVDALAKSELSSAVNTALAQAKASGEFDGEKGDKGDKGDAGYTPRKNIDYFDGDDYVLTPDDKNEIAELAAGMVEVPESSGGGIAVTGAKVGQTVKISAVDENGVPTAWLPTDFPSGGGGERTIPNDVILASGTFPADSPAWTNHSLGLTIGDLKKWKMVAFVAKLGSNSYLHIISPIANFIQNNANSTNSFLYILEWLDTDRTIFRIFSICGDSSIAPTVDWVADKKAEMIFGSGAKINREFGIWGSETDRTELKWQHNMALTAEGTWIVQGIVRYEEE